MTKYRKVVVGLAAVALAVGLWWYLGGQARSLTIRFVEAIHRLGPSAPVVFGVVYVLACLVGLPGSVLTVAAGFLFGAFWGTLIVSVSSTLGAVAAFCVARYLLRDHVVRWGHRYRAIAALDEAIATNGFQTVLLLRLSPLVPFNAFNYLMGVTRVSLAAYAAGSWLGMLPGTTMYVYAGALMRDLGNVAAGREGGSTWHIVFTAVGLAATAYVAILVTARARRFLATRQAVGQTHAEGRS